MNDDEFERRVSDAFWAKARAEIDDTRLPPPLAARATHASHTSHRATAPRSRLARFAPVAAAAAVLALVAGLFVFRDSIRDVRTEGQPVQPGSAHASKPGASSSTDGAPPKSATTTAPAAAPVHVRLKFSDGSQFGVGIPIIAYFSKKLSDGKAFSAATHVTVDGQPAQGAWYFESSASEKGYPLEAHFRLQEYWPAHAEIKMDLPVQGLSAGKGLAFDNSLTLAFTTGAANIATVDDATHSLSLTTDGKPVGSFPVSLGATNTPTANGTKVIMEKGASICMSGPGYHECGVKWTQRLTYGGEYLHAAPWNTANLGRADSSNGCTNLSITDAKKLYDQLNIGDVVLYPNANGPKMTLGAGYGDWNVPWPQWLSGGAVPTR
ncbi:MAG: L,D-transpeptidase [Pseudonocardiales bacterium]|nr:L,D-transpeptidase [Actinomycetota bacterium]